MSDDIGAYFRVAKILSEMGGGGTGSSHELTPYQRQELALQRQKSRESELDRSMKLMEKQQEFLQKEQDRTTQLGLQGTSIRNREQDDAAKLRFEMMKFYGQTKNEQLKRYDEQTKQIINAFPKVTDADKAQANLLADLNRVLNLITSSPDYINNGKVNIDGFLLNEPSVDLLKKRKESYYPGLSAYQMSQMEENLKYFRDMDPSRRSQYVTSNQQKLQELTNLIEKGGAKDPAGIRAVIEERNKGAERRGYIYNDEAAKRFVDDAFESARMGDTSLHDISIPPMRYEIK